MNIEIRNAKLKEVIAYLSVMVGLHSQKDREEYALRAIKKLKEIHEDEQDERLRYKQNESKL